jgi:hypothetical protein
MPLSTIFHDNDNFTNDNDNFTNLLLTIIWK